MANYILLQSITLGAAAASVTFTNLPTSGYTDLKVTMSARGSASQEAGDFLLSLNGSTSNFTMRRLFTFQSTVYGDTGGGSFNYLGQYPGAVQTANTFGIAEFTIPNYRATKPTPINSTSQDETNSTSALTYIGSNIWNDSSAISNFTISGNAGNFVAGSTFNVYGIAATGTTPTNPKAIGGDIVVNNGTYWYHAFLSSGTFTPSETLSCDVLVVAGGGGGGGGNNAGPLGAGGGAGGLLAYAAQSLTATGYTVTVGAGGAGQTVTTGTNGANSSFGILTASVGGGGGAGGAVAGGLNGASGGSGGGGSAWNSPATGIGGSPTSGQGNAGGSISGQGANRAAAGGGGAGGSAASSSTSAVGTAGGAGSNTYSSWASATSTGVSGFYAGGGGGQSGSGVGEAGGSGGGGAGVWGAAGISATTNTGSGGGAGGTTGGSGGSGIVIVRYAV